MAVLKRKFGSDGVQVSELALGTMRFSEKGFSEERLQELLREAIDLGITTLHSSYEYGSFELFCSAFRKLPVELRNQCAHVVKLPAPHFKDAGFRETLLQDRIDIYRKGLGIDCIDVVQWMYRCEPLDDEHRIPLARKAEPQLADAFATLRKQGSIRTASLFPYTREFAGAMENAEWLEGQVNYLNPLELEYRDFLDAGSFMALRPLASGRLAVVDADVARERLVALGESSLLSMAIRFPLYHSGVSCVIASASSIEQLRMLAGCVEGGIESSISNFNRIANEDWDRIVQRF